MPLELYPSGGEAAWLHACCWSKGFRPRFCETDALGHVSNVSYTAYIEIGRLDFFNELGDPDRGRASFAFMHNAAEIGTRFLRPCFYDEPLVIHTRVAKLGTSSLILEHAIAGEHATDIRTIARVALVSVKDDRTIPWSDAQRALLTPLVR